MREAIEQFRDAIRAAGLTPPDEIRADGDIHRFSTSGKPRDDAGYYVLHLDGIPAGHFGCWRTGLSENWQADIGRKLTPEEGEANRKRMAELKAQREAEEAKRRAAAAHKAGELWKAGTPAGEDHPYLARKGIRPVETLRELPADELARVIGYRPQASGEPLAGRVLLASVKIGGKLSTVEMIDESGRKSALKDGAKSGGYWAAQPLPDGDAACILIAEGVATALSAREATGHPVIAALSAGQLEAAAKAIRNWHPSAAIVILADLLKDTGEPDPRAIQVARAVGGAVAVPDFGDSREAGDTDFNDLAAGRGLEAVRKAVAAAIPATGTASPADDAKAAGVDPAGWPAPQPLRARIASEPYPLDALPAGIQAAVREVAGFVQAPLALVASSALAALSLAAQARADVKRAERLQGPAGLFMLTIADSGERKTTCDSFFTTTVREYEAEQAELSKPAVKNYEAAMAAWAAEREGILSAIKDAGKKRRPADKQRADLAELERDKPEPPRVPRLIYGDATPEALTWGLAKHWPSAGIVSSEAASIFGSHGMGRESIMRSLGILNTLWDGVSQRFDRRTSDSFTVRGARLTVALQVQEATLNDFFGRSGALARGSGFLARFLVAWPESTQGQRLFTEAPAAWPALAAFHRRLAAILAEPVQLDDDGGLTPPVLAFTPEARRDWIAFHDAIETDLRSGGELRRRSRRSGEGGGQRGPPFRAVPCRSTGDAGSSRAGCLRRGIAHRGLALERGPALLRRTGIAGRTGGCGPARCLADRAMPTRPHR